MTQHRHKTAPRPIHPRFFTDDMATFIRRMSTYAEEQNVSRQRIRKVVKFLERVTAPYQRLDEVFLRFMPSQLRKLDTAPTTIEQDKMNIIAMTLWDLYRVQWAHDCRDRNMPAAGEVETFIREFLHSQLDENSETALHDTFRSGYCYHFAHILKSVFRRGEVCWAAPYGHIVWVDTDGVPYDVEGRYVGESDKFIPVRYIAEHLEDFTHTPDLKYIGGAPHEYIADAVRRYDADMAPAKEE